MVVRPQVLGQRYDTFRNGQRWRIEREPIVIIIARRSYSRYQNFGLAFGARNPLTNERLLRFQSRLALRALERQVLRWVRGQRHGAFLGISIGGRARFRGTSTVSGDKHGFR